MKSGTAQIHGERGSASITGVWGRSPQRGPGAEPLVGESGGRNPLKLKAFSLFGSQWNGKTFAISVFCSFCVQWDFLWDCINKCFGCFALQ